MITCNFGDRRISLYERLYRSIKADIERGSLKAGERLPSKRSLSQQLKISVITVENAYAQLLSEGYIYSAERKGYFVSKLEQNFLNESLPAPFVCTDKKEAADYFLDLKTNSIQPDRFPFSAWAKLMREVLSERDKRLLEVMPNNGVRELREEISKHLYHFRGMSVSPDQIIVGAGTEYLYGIMIQLLGRDSIFAVENPGYQKISKIYAKNDVKCRHIGLDEYGLSAAKLKKSAAHVVHISPSHHFPLGIIMPVQRRQEILKWAGEAENRYIIEDDYDSEFRFASRPIPAMQSIDTNERVIYVNTFTKSLAPSIRISYMVLPAHLMRRYNEELGFYSCTVASFEQYTLAKFMAGGYLERHINRVRNTYKALRDLLIDALKKSPLWDKCTIYEENAGLHFLLRLKSGKSEAELVRAAADAGIRISCLSEYYKGPRRPGHPTIVINYSGIDSDKIEKAVERLSKALI